MSSSWDGALNPPGTTEGHREHTAGHGKDPGMHTGKEESVLGAHGGQGEHPAGMWLDGGERRTAGPALPQICWIFLRN